MTSRRRGDPCKSISSLRGPGALEKNMRLRICQACRGLKNLAKRNKNLWPPDGFGILDSLSSPHKRPPCSTTNNRRGVLPGGLSNNDQAQDMSNSLLQSDLKTTSEQELAAVSWLAASAHGPRRTKHFNSPALVHSTQKCCHSPHQENRKDKRARRRVLPCGLGGAEAVGEGAEGDVPLLHLLPHGRDLL